MDGCKKIANAIACSGADRGRQGQTGADRGRQGQTGADRGRQGQTGADILSPGEKSISPGVIFCIHFLGNTVLIPLAKGKMPPETK
jgi:hypothetical protein